MGILFSHRGFLRCICLCTVSTMLPTSVQAWHFLPAVQTLIPSADDGPVPLPSDKVAELNTVNAAVPTPLSAQQRAALQSDTPASAETKVAAANNAVALPNLNFGAVKPSDQVGLRYMDREELSQIASTVPPERPLHNPALPEAADVLARIQSAVNSTPEEETPVKVAQAAGAPTLPGEREVRGPRGPQEAVAALAEADDLAAAGHRAEALQAYFDVMDTYGGTNEALWADQGMWNALNELSSDALDRETIAEFEGHLRAWAPKTANGAYAALTWDSVRALAEHKRGNAELALAYAALAESRCLEFLRAHGASYLSMSAADYYQEIVDLQGPEKEREAMLALREQALSLESGPGRLGAIYAFGSHAASISVNAAGEAINAWSNVISEVKRPYFNALLEDETVPFWAKGFLCEYAGRAHAGLGDYEQAKAWYDRGVALSERVGPTHWFLAFMSSLATTRMHPMNPELGVDAMAAYLAKYPDSTYAANAYIELGALFTLAGDYKGATEFYSFVAQRGEKDPLAAVAEHELDYILRNLYESRPTYAAREETPEQLAARKRAEQMCGPMALAEALHALGIEADTDHLADVAGTTEAGTSMLGLVEAARAQGATLGGVLASSPEELTLPAIAYVNKNHFVAVLSVKPDAIEIYDPREGQRRSLNRAAFGSMWDGQALVVNPKGEDKLPSDVLAANIGGDGTAQMPNPNYTPYEDFVGGEGGAGFEGNDPAAIAQGPNLATPVNSPGVNLMVNAYESCVDIRESDLTLGVRGPLEVEFGRRFINEKGWLRQVFNGRMGGGWTSNLSVYVLTGPLFDPYDSYKVVESLVLQDSSGTARDYVWSHTSGGYDYFERSSTGQTSEKGIVVRATHTTTSANRRYYVDFPDGKRYEFSPAQSSNGNSTARLEYIKDAGSANTVTFLYDSTNYHTGKLTKVQSPLGDARHFLFAYDIGNKITKAELKASSTVLQTVNYAYTGGARLTKVTYNDGKTIQYTYGSQGGGSAYIDSVTDRAGKVTNLDWSFTDDASGAWGAYKIEVSAPADAPQIFERSVSTSVNTTTRNDGLSDLSKAVTTPLVGDASRMRYRDSYADGSTYDRWEYEYDGGKDLTSAVAPNSVAMAEFTYTTTGRVSTTANADGNESTFYYSNVGSLVPTKSRDIFGLDTDFEYDVEGRITSVLPPNVGASELNVAYDGLGQISSTTDINGNITTYAYDGLGRLTSTIDPQSNMETTAFDIFGNLTSATDPDNNTTTMEYDIGGCGACGGGGLLTKTSDPNGNVVTVEHDNNGNITKQTDALGVISALQYDNMNRLTRVERPSGSGHFDTITYDERGRVSTAVNAVGRELLYEYDFQGNLTRQFDGIGTYVAFTYDSLGRVSTIVDGVSNSKTNDYDDAGRVTRVTYADGKIVRSFFDTTGRVTKVGAGSLGTIDPIETQYDGDSRVTKTTYTSGLATFDILYHFDADGELTKMTDWLDSINGIQYAYDNYGQLTRLTDYDGSHLDYAYDSRGRITSQSDYHGNVTYYSYNGLGQFSTLTAPGSNVWTFHYDDLERLTKKSLPNGMDSIYEYDGEGRLTAALHKDGGTVKESFVYGYNESNEKTKVTTSDGSHWKYFYDARRRLTKAERFDGSPALLHRFEYTYDGADNLLTKSVYDTGTSITTATTFTHNSANEQISANVGGSVTTQTYDAWGRLTKRDDGTHEATYAYRYGGKLYSVTSDFPGEGNVVYETGGDGKRRSRVSGMDETWYNWDAGWTVLSEEDHADGASGDLKRTYRGRNGAHVDGDDPATGAWKFYTHDDLGTSRSIWNDDKSLYASFEQTPYGEAYAASGSTAGVTRRFTGHDWDEATQTLFAPYRHYNPAAARWLSRDPLGSIDGPNEFAYVGGNPVMVVDPMGLLGYGGPEDSLLEEMVNRRLKEQAEDAAKCRARIKKAQRRIYEALKGMNATVTYEKVVRHTSGPRYTGSEGIETTETVTETVNAANILMVEGDAGPLLGAWGKSHSYMKFTIDRERCKTMSDKTLTLLVAHEAAHAVRNFSRTRHVVSIFANGDMYGEVYPVESFHGEEEAIARKFALLVSDKIYGMK